MAIYTGKEAVVKFGDTTIMDLVSYTMTVNAPLLGEPVFGEEWNRVAGQGIKDASGSLSGLLNTADTTGQNVLEDACVSGTMQTNFRLYVNDTDYWTSNTGANADAGCYFTNYGTTAEANGITKVSCDFQFTLDVHRTS